VRSRVLKTTALAAVAARCGHEWQVALHLRRLSLKCWFIGHDDWIRRTPDKRQGNCAPASVGSPMRSTRCERPRSHHGGDITLAA